MLFYVSRLHFIRQLMERVKSYKNQQDGKAARRREEEESRVDFCGSGVWMGRRRYVYGHSQLQSIS